MIRRLSSSLSRVMGSIKTPLFNITIGDMMKNTVEKYPDKSALIVAEQNIHWTYAGLSTQIDALARGLSLSGLKKGDRLGIWLHNCSEWTVLQFATAQLGIILVNINPAYRPIELRHCLNLVQCKAIVLKSQSEHFDILTELCPELSTSTPGQLEAEELPSLKTVITTHDTSMVSAGCIDYEELRSTSQPIAIVEELNPNDPINIQFTSGTTGAPKRATLTHNNILNNGYFVGEALQLTWEDRICIPVPLYHCFGMVLGNIACVTHGSCMVYPKAPFNAANTLDTVSREKCTGLYGVPTMFINELALPDFHTYDLSSLRTGIMAGSVCPIDTMTQVMDKMHMKEVSICYGMTETSPVSFQSAIDDPPEKRASTVGRVHPHVECKIVHASTGETVRVGMAGELYTRGYHVMQGYWNDLQKTRESIDTDGWMKTGDLAVLDKDGYCTIVGRLKDVIIRGGENIYPREIEDHLLSHECIQNAAVVGLPDAYYGEIVCACLITADPDQQQVSDIEIQTYIGQSLAKYKIPKFVLS